LSSGAHRLELGLHTLDVQFNRIAAMQADTCGERRRGPHNAQTHVNGLAIDLQPEGSVMRRRRSAGLRETEATE
jgi:hypothetical protein